MLEELSSSDTMNKANLAIIFKKGNPELPQSYITIALLNMAYTFLAVIILKRVVPHIDGTIDKAQYGFRNSISTAQPLSILRRAQEIQEEAELEAHILFLDWKTAFDKVDQQKCLIATTRIGIPPKVVHMIKAIYGTPQCSVKDGTTTTENWKQHTGIRQGCPHSPYFLFLLLPAMMEDIKDDLTEEETAEPHRGILHHEITKDLFYADDTIIMTTTTAATQIMLHRIQHIIVQIHNGT